MKTITLLRITIVLTFTFLIAVNVIAPVYAGTTGIISGIAVDSESGGKLAGVNVIIKGTGLTTVTDENGYYVITNVPPGNYKVVFSLVGYGDTEIEKIGVLMDVTTPVDAKLLPSVTEEEFIVSEARPMVRRDVVPTMYVVDSDQEQMVKGQPNSLYQTPAIVLTQPGIIADEGGYPHIRGGRANQIAYLLDGIPITEPVTNGFGTNAVTVGLDKMEIYTGGYRPEYSNAISGVFNQIIKTGKNAPGISLETLGGSDSYKGIYPQIGGVTDKGLDYYAAAYLWSSDLEGLSYNEANSSDIIGKFSYPLGSKDKLTFLAVEGSAKYQFPTSHTQTFMNGAILPTDEERDHGHQSYLINALTLNHTINSASFFTIRPYYYRNRWKMEALSDDIGYWWDGESTTNGIMADYTNQVSEQHLLKAGFTRMASNNRYWARVPVLDDYYGYYPEYGEYNYQANADTVQTGLYIQDQMVLSPKWRAEAGLRYDLMHYDKVAHADSSESQWSPRMGLSYALDSRTNLRFSYGKMIQFVHTQAIERDYADPESEWALTYYGAGTGNLRPEQSTQYDFGWERQVNDNYSVQVTPFYRKFSNMLQTIMLDPENPDISPVAYENLGEGTSTGIELLIKKKPSDNWSGWLSYTYAKAKAEGSSAADMITPGVTHYVDWDQRHTIALVLNHFNRDWTYSLLGEYGSGLPYGEGNSQRAPSHLAFGLNISKDVKGGWLSEGKVNLSISNLFNVGTVLDREPVYDPDTYEIIGYDPSASLSPRFVNLSYTRRY